MLEYTWQIFLFIQDVSNWYLLSLKDILLLYETLIHQANHFVPKYNGFSSIVLFL